MTVIKKIAAILRARPSYDRRVGLAGIAAFGWTIRTRVDDGRDKVVARRLLRKR